MSKDLYGVLGLNKNATDAEIKKAFKKKALQFHPDKFTNKSDKEKKEAEDKFKEINEAYQVLSDPQKKKNYDQFGTIDGSGGMPDMNDFFAGMKNSFFGGFNPFGGFQRGPSGPEPGQTLQYDLGLTIDEIFNGATKDISYFRKVRCSTCNGEGGKGIKTCPNCNGTGQIVHTTRQGFTTLQQVTTCPHCNGTGKIVEEKCKDCNGTGFKQVKETISVNVPPGTMAGQHIKFNGKGNESKNKNGANGDLNIFIHHNIDSAKYRIMNNTVYELIEVPYYDCLLGKEFEHKIPSGKVLKVKIPECAQDCQQLSPFKCMGIKGIGDYIIMIKVKMPKSLTKNEKKHLEKIQKGED